MAAFNFPNSPSVNDIHTENGVSFKWNGTIWKKVGASYLDTTNLNVTGIGTIAGNFNVGGVLTYEDVKNVDSVGIITARTGLSVTAGDVVIPDTIVHAGDTNTKIRFPGADTFSVETAGSERFRITSTGALEGQTAYAGVGINTFAKFTRTGGGGPHLEIGYNAVTTDYGYFGTGSAHDLGLRTNDVTRLRITSAGKLGLGVASPASESGWGNILHINSASAGAHIRFTDNTSGSGAGDGSYIGHYGNDTYLVNKESSGVIIFNTNANERLRIGSAGQLGIGGATYGSSGQVLTSQGSGAAPQWATVSGGATETVGTWTPTLARVSGGAISGSYTTQFARYVKIGKLVNIELEIVLASVSSQGTGRPYITGLPFAPNREWSGNGNIMTFSIMQYNLNSGMIFASTTNSNCILIKEGAGADQTVMGDGGQTASLYNWKAGKIIANLIYQTA